MKTMNTEELLRDLEIMIKNDTSAKINHQREGKFERKRKIGMLKQEIISRVK